MNYKSYISVSFPQIVTVEEGVEYTERILSVSGQSPSQTDRHTDRRTTCRGNTAHCIASHSNNSCGLHVKVRKIQRAK